jgi:FAD/FMN-containing dehydrogenase
MPVSRMEAYVTQLAERCTAAGFVRAFGAFGHLGDGNIHLIAALGSAADLAHLDPLVYEPLRGYGSVSAEHGIGTLKREWLALSRNPTEIAMMRVLKGTLDPRGILNPGRVV